MIIDRNLSREFRRVADDRVAANKAVVSDMHVFHEKIVATDLGDAFRGRATGDCDILTDAVTVTDLADGILSAELQILRFG